ncbi:DUF3288 family protein [Synechocystis sp. PCC 7509]|uniref:DUF3288 family protein n=1 Tax=Synechocystis sp. PCC 7509 TaxID=927677 RepID=UPI0002AC5618|nr:DUF3288 family protein [Synechocystis sp. PCC 7509]
MSETENQDRQHPLHGRDRIIVNNLLISSPTDYNLAELARLRIRYNGFPGARDIQGDLDLVLQNWEITETQLFAKTRQIHANQPLYKGKANKGEDEDWS